MSSLYRVFAAHRRTNEAPQAGAGDPGAGGAETETHGRDRGAGARDEEEGHARELGQDDSNVNATSCALQKLVDRMLSRAL